MKKLLESAYKEYYSLLYSVAAKIMNTHEEREEIIHQVFLKLLEKDSINIPLSEMKSYLCRAVINTCYNKLRDQRNVSNHHKSIQAVASDIYYNVAMEKKDEIRIVREAVETLPEQCKVIFKKSRFDEMSLDEIANELGIAKKTVKNQLTKAIKIVHQYLTQHSYFKNYLILIVSSKIVWFEIGLCTTLSVL